MEQVDPNSFKVLSLLAVSKEESTLFFPNSFQNASSTKKLDLILLGSFKADKKAWNGLKEALLKVKALQAAHDA